VKKSGKGGIRPGKEAAKGKWREKGGRVTCVAGPISPLERHGEGKTKTGGRRGKRGKSAG